MTTSHRPTFESRRGRDLQPSSIVHSRMLPAHKQLKYRITKKHDDKNQSSININEAKAKFNELKQELLERENRHFNRDQLAIESGENNNVVETYAEKRKRIKQETAGLDDSDDDDDEDTETIEGGNNESDESASESDESDDDEDDEAELLKELAKIKQERAEQAKQKELQSIKESALTSNPLLNPLKPTSIRKNWRQDSVFKHQNNTEKPQTDDDFVNDLIRSDFHKKFMSRYIK